jgi:hypothetical protein
LVFKSDEREQYTSAWRACQQAPRKNLCELNGVVFLGEREELDCGDNIQELNEFFWINAKWSDRWVSLFALRVI